MHLLLDLETHPCGGRLPTGYGVTLRVDTCVVVPCYNEALRLDMDQIAAWLALHRQFRFLFVDDGSQDGTAALLRSASSQHAEQIHAIYMKCNQGKAEAVRQGMQALMKDPSIRYAGYFDADLATPLDELALLRDELALNDENDLIIAARVQLLGRDIHRSALRHYLGRMFATAAALCLGIRVFDTQCGAKMFRLSDATRNVFQTPFASRWVFDVEIFARYLSIRSWDGSVDEGLKIYEVPVRCWRDVAGSKVKARHFFIAFFDLGRILATYRRPGRHFSKHHDTAQAMEPVSR